MKPSEHLLSLLKKLNFPPEDFVLFGSAPLAIRDLRRIGDLDVYGKTGFWAELAQDVAWKFREPDPRDPPFLENYVNGVRITVFSNWKDREWAPDLNYHLNNPEMIKGWPFVPLQTMLEWKAFGDVQRSKDAADVKLMEEYLGIKHDA